LTIRKIVTGLSVTQEYVCLDLFSVKPFASVLLTWPGSPETVDISANHLFLGYKPMIIALCFSLADRNSAAIAKQESVRIDFRHEGHHALARIVLKKIHERVCDGTVVVYYEGVHGTHNFLSGIHQWIGRMREAIRKRTAGNVGLPGNLYDQVRIAYSVPRIIALITLQDGELMNMFPTDLHGAINARVYAGSLRIGGKANEQVEKCRRIVVSHIKSERYKEVYSLGRNHMQEMKAKENFSVSQLRSHTFNIPLPDSVTEYFELELETSFDAGIHRIHHYRIVYHHREGTSCLAHVHQYYAQWRQDHSLPLTMLLR